LNRSDAAVRIGLQGRYGRIRDSIDNAVMAATALDVAMPAVETPTGMDATLSPVAGDVGAHVIRCHEHKTSRPPCRPAATA
jgi:hypothetical protein